MRIADLQEGYVYTKKNKITPQETPEEWVELIHNEKAPSDDVKLFNRLRRISNKLGGKGNTIKILRMM